MLRFRPLIPTNGIFPLCMVSTLRFCSSTPSTPASTQSSSAQSSPSSSSPSNRGYFKAHDIILLPISRDTFAVTGARHFRAAIAPFTKHFQANQGKFSRKIVDPQSKKNLRGWVFHNSSRPCVESWMKSFEKEMAKHPIARNYQKVVAPNGALELVRLNDRWYVIRSTENFPKAAMLYTNPLKTQARAGYCKSLSEYLMNWPDRIVAKTTFPSKRKDPWKNYLFPGWVVSPDNRQRSENWIKSLVVPPDMNSIPPPKWSRAKNQNKDDDDDDDGDEYDGDERAEGKTEKQSGHGSFNRRDDRRRQ